MLNLYEIVSFPPARNISVLFPLYGYCVIECRVDIGLVWFMNIRFICNIIYMVHWLISGISFFSHTIEKTTTSL